MKEITKLIENLNGRIVTTHRSNWNQLMADAIFELKIISNAFDDLYLENKKLSQENAMMRDSIFLALKAMEGGFLEKMDYKQFDMVKLNIEKSLELAK